ncbi:precorrin-2 dehydrogenase/sirohydrochlorin ferrochelatase family protein [Paenibacillus mendelii]|uniref:precorrin-2 dehydrogenase n=1 Tax=Paenibacillus mendelii TaxID=206163 RepID=A0ABV6JA50_9BACL|nr:bifunctional precorrin-2 dehydrogenase/sirohydrochlorin ferrochelatase [Paenibacillus mendelii]MCQ6560845.1 bifunctional precorrin-2 dehydrogenase/sirohydrochlorin ferrochelatase [Paenibacillus mendelii]
MAGYYPLMLDLKGKLCVVIGGGSVAERKIRSLLDADADRVRAISPVVTEGIEGLAAGGSIVLERREYLEQDLNNASLVFAATDDPILNHSLAAAATAVGALVNVADDSHQGDFVTPAVIRRGDLVIALTTGGASPALASLIGRELQVRYGPDYAGKVVRLRELREQVLKRLSNPEERRAVLRLAAEELNTASSAEPSDDGDEEQMEEWIRRLQAAADRRLT